MTAVRALLARINSRLDEIEAGPAVTAVVNATLVPLAAELVATVRDYGPDDVAAVLARVPDGRHDALAVVLAAMVDPDKTPSQLLSWTKRMAESRDKTPAHLTVAQVNAVSDGRRPERRQQVAMLSAKGLTVAQISERLGITTRAVTRHRTAIRKLLGVAS